MLLLFEEHKDYILFVSKKTALLVGLPSVDQETVLNACTGDINVIYLNFHEYCWCFSTV